MRTTLEIEDSLLREAKRRAAEQERTLTALVRDALRQYLANPVAAEQPFRLQLLTKRGRRTPPVNLADRDSLYEVMEGRG